MSIPRSVAAVIRHHVTLEVEGTDCLYLNVYQPKLQTEKQLEGDQALGPQLPGLVHDAHAMQETYFQAAPPAGMADGAASQTFPCLSPAAARRLPSGLKATLVSRSACPGRERVRWPVWGWAFAARG
jgi:hypothetical protein